MHSVWMLECSVTLTPTAVAAQMVLLSPWPVLQSMLVTDNNSYWIVLELLLLLLMVVVVLLYD